MPAAGKMTVRCRALSLRRAYPMTPPVRAIWLPNAGQAGSFPPAAMVVRAGRFVANGSPGRHIITSHSNGVSALQQQAQLGLRSYKSAWLMLQKLCRAMVDPDRRFPGCHAADLPASNRLARIPGDPALGPSRLRQSQNLGPRRLPRPAQGPSSQIPR